MHLITCSFLSPNARPTHSTAQLSETFTISSALQPGENILFVFFYIGCCLLPVPSLILHLVIPILNMFAVYSICVFVFYLVVCFVSFRFVFGSFVFAVCISVGRSFNYLRIYNTRVYAYWAMCNVHAFQQMR